MLLAFVFHTKITNCKGEGDRTHHMFPQAGCVGEFIISMLGQPLLEELVG